MSNDVRAHKDVNDRAHGRVAEPSPCVHGIRQTQLAQRPPPVVQKGAPPASDPQNDQAVSSTDMSLTNTTMMASPRGMTSTGYRGGYRNKGRRDYQGQRNFNNGFYHQNKQFSSGVDIAEPGQTRQWRREGTLNYNNRHQNNPHCINSRADPYDYNDCSCGGCAERNKSIWVRVKDSDSDTKDLQARLKFGLGARFGDVDEVFPIFHRLGNAFVVRFKIEDSVREALGFGNIALPEKDLSLLIGPTHRSKWIGKTYIGLEQSRRQRSEQRPQYQCMTQPQFNQGMYPGGGYGPMPFVPRDHQHMRSFSQHGVHHPPGNFQYMQRGAPMPSYFRGGGDSTYIPNCGPQYMGQQQPPFLQPAQEQHTFHHHGFGQAAFSQSEQRLPSRAQPAKSAECKSQSKPPFEEALENTEPTGQPQQRAVTPESHPGRTPNHKAKVSLPPVTPTKLVDAEYRKGEGGPGSSNAATPPPTRDASQTGSTDRGKDDDADTNTLTSASEVTERAVAGRKTFCIAQSSETSALVVESTAMGTHSRAPSVFTDKERKEREQARDSIAIPLNPHKVNKAPVKSKPSNMDKSTEPVEIRDPASNTYSEACTLIRPSQADTDTLSLDSSESSKTMSIPSTTGTPPSSHQNYTKTPFNSATKDDTHVRHRRQGSQSSPSPSKSVTRSAREENTKTQQESATSDEPHVLNAAARDFNFPGHGRGTIRIGKRGEKATILNEMSLQGRGRNTARKNGKKSRQQPVAANDAACSQQKSVDEAETGNQKSSAASGHDTSQVSSRFPQQGHFSGENSALRDVGVSATASNVPVASSLKIHKKRRNNRKLGALFANDGRNEKEDQTYKSGRSSVDSTVEGASRDASSSSSASKDCPFPVRNVQESDSSHTRNASRESLQGEHGSLGEKTKGASEGGDSTPSVADGSADISVKAAAQNRASAEAEEGKNSATTKSGKTQDKAESTDEQKSETPRKATSGSVLDERAWPSLPRSGRLSPQSKTK
ncbi:hypothetical protein C2857_003686 [Epichloe festucae Fl1]|uniref:Uncharacterized protein n=1 Tax=Epichloe festucae (strain Fl1) TaxID=877507 RepID=A0A7S9KNX7_EPIFF|nr:hypothetical protein C2857_003686 [Epichloe festucae Fl1]